MKQSTQNSGLKDGGTGSQTRPPRLKALRRAGAPLFSGGFGGFWVALLGLLTLTTQAQENSSVRIGGPFRVPVYDRQNRVVALLIGRGVQTPSRGHVTLQTVRVLYYDLHGGTNLVILGTNCLYDAAAQMATSPDELHVETGDGRLSVAGRGFTWWQTNNDLAISNDVRTTVQPRPGSAQRQPLHIRAGAFRLEYPSNLIHYTHGVQVKGQEFDVNCGSLDIQRAGSAGLRRITARDHVQVLNHRDGSRTTGEYAVYDDERDRVEITGSPEWQNGPRRAWADEFRLDQRRRLVQALGHARLQLPRRIPGHGGLLFGPLESPQPSRGGTNQWVEITAQTMALQLPPTNGPAQSVVAETNVVITDMAQGGRATAQKLSYDPAGLITLSGHPQWAQGERLLKAEVLTFDTVKQTFAARTNAFLRLPLRLSGAVVSSQPPQSTGPVTNTVDIHSDYLTYTKPWLRFGDRVRAVWRAGKTELGKATCTSLSLQYDDHLEAVTAGGGVQAEQFPFRTASGRWVERHLATQTVAAQFTPQGWLKDLIADGHVRGEQREWLGTNTATALVKQVETETLRAQFAPTNRVQTAVAEGGVRLSEGKRTARSERAVYSASDNLLRLLGNPVATLPEGRITQADELMWDRTTGHYLVVGKFKSEWNSALLRGSATNLLRQPSPPRRKAPPSVGQK